MTRDMGAGEHDHSGPGTGGDDLKPQTVTDPSSGIGYTVDRLGSLVSNEQVKRYVVIAGESSVNAGATASVGVGFHLDTLISDVQSEGFFFRGLDAEIYPDFDTIRSNADDVDIIQTDSAATSGLSYRLRSRNNPDGNIELAVQSSLSYDLGFFYMVTAVVTNNSLILYSDGDVEGDF